MASGSIFSGGYQFPRTRAGDFRANGPAIKEEKVPGGSVRIVPMRTDRGGRLWMVVATWVDSAGAHRQRASKARDELEALSLFREALAVARRG